jgi:ABC-type amino acid transport substrate-binding protein
MTHSAPCSYRFRPVLLALWALLAWTRILGAAASPAPPPAPADIQRILTRGVLVVAMPSFDAPPFFYRQGGILRGLDVELAYGVAEALKVLPRFDRQASTFNGAVEVVARGEADLAVCKLSRTLGRASRVRFSEPYLTLHHALALNRLRFADLARGRDLASVIRSYNDSLGVIEASSFVDFAGRNFPRARLVKFKDWPAVTAALKRGQVTAAYRDEFEINCLLKSDPRMALTLRAVTLADTEDSLGVAVPPDSQQLLALVNLYLAQRHDKLTIETVMKRFEEVRP